MERVAPRRRFASTICLFNRFAFNGVVLAALLVVCFAPTSQGKVKKYALMINELGQSHPGPVIVTNGILSALHEDGRFDVDFQWENLDAADISDDSLSELRGSIARKYRKHKFDVIVLLGPDPLRFLGGSSKTFYPDVPVVFCCSVPGQVDPRTADSRSTGSWFQLHPAKTLDAALRLLPDTHQVFVVDGQSRYDRGLAALVKAGLTSYGTRLNITYLTDLSMTDLQERLKHLPSNSIVLYVSFFKDAQGRDFLNVAEALPLVIAASNAPVFGLSDTYIGHGIVGGFVVSFEEQGKIAARDVLEILGGKAPKDIPIVHGPSVSLFDWRELQRWKLNQARLPTGSIILFRESTFWERYKWTMLAGLMALMGLAVLTAYLLFERKQLKSARETQHQLSGMLINAQEAERRRLAAELHDDFSQRLAMLALGLGTAAQAIPNSPQDANRQLEKLSNEVGNIGGDLHTLSHRLHSASLESLGLAPTVSAFCKEFSVQQGVKIEFTHDHIPRKINPDVALCVFRIAQEALRNIKTHSGADSAQVRLRVTGSTIHLLISDQGAGFDPKDLKMNEGLGVRSTGERARLLGGHFVIRSAAGSGTTPGCRWNNQRPNRLPECVKKAKPARATYETLRSA
jgi:signal transduction histidine kinase